jgi:hypothetical protein
LTRRLLWRFALLGAAIGTATTVFAGRWTTLEMLGSALLLAGILTLHPLMDQPVPVFEGKLLSPRF